MKKSRMLKPNYIFCCSQLTFVADIRNAKKQIFERRTNLLDRTTVNKELSIETEMFARMQCILCFLGTNLYDYKNLTL